MPFPSSPLRSALAALLPFYASAFCFLSEILKTGSSEEESSKTSPKLPHCNFSAACCNKSCQSKFFPLILITNLCCIFCVPCVEHSPASINPWAQNKYWIRMENLDLWEDALDCYDKWHPTKSTCRVTVESALFSYRRFIPIFCIKTNKRHQHQQNHHHPTAVIVLY